MIFKPGRILDIEWWITNKGKWWISNNEHRMPNKVSLIRHLAFIIQRSIFNWHLAFTDSSQTGKAPFWSEWLRFSWDPGRRGKMATKNYTLTHAAHLTNFELVFLAKPLFLMAQGRICKSNVISSEENKSHIAYRKSPISKIANQKGSFSDSRFSRRTAKAAPAAVRSSLRSHVDRPWLTNTECRSIPLIRHLTFVIFNYSIHWVNLLS